LAPFARGEAQRPQVAAALKTHPTDLRPLDAFRAPPWLAPQTTPTVVPGLARISFPLVERGEVWGWRRLVGWIVAWVEHCQLEAATPGPRLAVFAFWRQRLSGNASRRRRDRVVPSRPRRGHLQRTGSSCEIRVRCRTERRPGMKPVACRYSTKKCRRDPSQRPAGRIGWRCPPPRDFFVPCPVLSVPVALRRRLCGAFLFSS